MTLPSAVAGKVRQNRIAPAAKAFVRCFMSSEFTPKARLVPTLVPHP
jgi:hypothetical protein